MWVIKHQFGVKMVLCNMRKIIYVLIVIFTLTSCITYVRETGRFYPRNRNLQPTHRMGINGYHLRNQYYFRHIQPLKKR
jgi:hypothetical protein